MVTSKRTNKSSNKPVKNKLTPEQRGQRLQRLLFGSLAIMIIATWIISMVAHY